MNYFRPHNLPDALNWLQENNAGIAAGCTDLFAVTKSQYLRKDGHDHLLDITAIEEISSIRRTSEGIRIGAAAKWSDIINAPLPPAFNGLKSAARQVGSVQIQNQATIGGNLCNASPAADGVPPLMVMNANVELASKSGKRLLPLSDFLLASSRTAITSDEILAAILIPESSITGKINFNKLGARKYLVISIAMVASRVVVAQNRLKDIAICVGSCSPVAMRLNGIEAALKDMHLEKLITNEKLLDATLRDKISVEEIGKDLSPIDDIRADRPYRISAAHEIIIRSLKDLILQESADE